MAARTSTTTQPTSFKAQFESYLAAPILQIDGPPISVIEDRLADAKAERPRLAAALDQAKQVFQEAEHYVVLSGVVGGDRLRAFAVAVTDAEVNLGACTNVVVRLEAELAAAIADGSERARANDFKNAFADSVESVVRELADLMAQAQPLAELLGRATTDFTHHPILQRAGVSGAGMLLTRMPRTKDHLEQMTREAAAYIESIRRPR